MTFTVAGTASGPYPGTFGETDTVTISPQTDVDPTTIDRGGLLVGHVVDISATFQITSGAYTITGTAAYAPDGLFSNGLFQRAFCADFSDRPFGPYPHTNGHVVEFATWSAYAATISGPEGTATRTGLSDIVGQDVSAQAIPPDVGGQGAGPALLQGFRTEDAPPPLADSDGDGVVDSIDVGAGAFDDGAGTTGAILDSAGYGILVEPAPGGVHITVTGSGTARAVFSACGFSTIRLSPGTDLILGCGSVKLKVSAGSAEVVLGGGITTVTIAAGSAAEVSDLGGGSFAIHNTGTGPVAVTTNGSTSTLAAGGSSAPHVVAIANVCGLTKLDIQASSKYLALAAKQRKVVDGLTTAACAFLQQITPKLSAKQKTALITTFKATTQALVAPGWLTRTQVTTITALAATL